MAQPLTEDLQAMLWNVRKGHHGSWAGLAAAVAGAAILLLALAVLIPQVRPVASLSALAALLALAFILIMLQLRSTGQVLDLSANLSLQSHLARSGFAA